ncbi:MAG: hypothetical protein CVU55_09250 [Deltaproteobacteria bacterium HGW-Deltaproteobacteria-13]|jgi:signal transduction histidine kinase|nr:MAG: hypothetical protein CVU55_09250 [Deltaproteobacteria bacterium HGW-Deltaproteobacteria-13]
MEQDRKHYEANVKAFLGRIKKRRSDIVKLVTQSISNLSPPDNITVTLSAFLEDHMVWIDAESILKTLINLETNAMEAMPDGGELFLGVEGDDHQVKITIRDTGTGISKENMDMLFTQYFSTKPAGEGTGLSLPMAYAAVREHGGKIGITSNDDPLREPTGTTVIITLPRARPDLSNVILHGEE